MNRLLSLKNFLLRKEAYRPPFVHVPMHLVESECRLLIGTFLANNGSEPLDEFFKTHFDYLRSLHPELIHFTYKEYKTVLRKTLLDYADLLLRLDLNSKAGLRLVDLALELSDESYTGRHSFNIHSMLPGKREDFRQWVIEASKDGRFPENRSSIEEMQKKKHNPSLIINSLPKSGTIFLSTALQQIADLQPIQATIPCENLYFDIIPNLTSLINKGGLMITTHLNPEPENMQILDEFTGGIVVHIRDPRQALASWVHYADKINFARYDFRKSEDISRLLKHHSLFVSFIEKWVEFVDKHTESAILTTHEELAESEAAVLERIKSKFTQYHWQPSELPVEKTAKTHYRSGKTREFETFFPPDILKTLSSMISPELQSRCGFY